MGSINKSHNEADGGILLFNGELILLYCDSVQCEIGGKESVKGRVYLTTHRMVMIVTPYRQTSAVKSLCAPFCAITKCNVEQPIFGANYIEATVRDESDGQRSFSFKLRFSKGGAIEFAMAMNRAVSMVGRNFNPNTPPPPAYTPSPSADYYQAPPTVYAPGYNCGVQMPVQQFPDQPPIGFIYASSAPPPYPGLGGNTGPGPAKPPPPYSQQPGGAYPQAGGQAGGYPGAQQGYPQQAPYSNPGQQQPGGHQQQPVGFAAPGFQAPGSGYGQQPAGYPQQQAPAGYPQQSTGYPQQQPPTGYPQQQPPAAGYPQQQPPSSGYPAASGYPQQPAGGQPPQQPPSTGYPQQPASGYPGTAPPTQTSSAYPDLSQAGNPAGQPASDPGTAAWPSAPSFNPNWQDEKKP